MSSETVARRLARWVVGLRYEDLPPEVVVAARRCVLDTLGVQIRGATLPWIQPVYRYIRTLAGGGDATVTWHGDRLSVPYAAYLNSTFSYSCELQHHGSPRSGHPGVVMVPAAQALGEVQGSTGRELITAVVAGYEIQGRLGLGLFDAMFGRHFHPPSVLGVFSAAATAGKMLNLDEDQLAQAFGIAGSHASGTLEYDQAGGEVKRVHGAIATRSGVESAFLAREGFTGPPAIFEGRRGIFVAFGGGTGDLEPVTSKLGEPYCITKCRFRVYPTVGGMHAALELVDRLAASGSVGHGDVQAIRVGMSADQIPHFASITRPTDVIGAQFSLAYSVAVRLVKGSNDLELYIDPRVWHDPEVLSVVDKVETYEFPQDPGRNIFHVEIRLKDGRVLEGEQEYAKGSAERPFTQEEIEGKFRRLAGVMMSKGRVEELLHAANRLEQLPSLSELVPLLVTEHLA